MGSQDTASQSATTISSERCPTCDGAETISLRGERVTCPTCCATHHCTAPMQKTLRSRAHGVPLAFLLFPLAAIATIAVLFAYALQLKRFF
jgi:hypothetical protein